MKDPKTKAALQAQEKAIEKDKAMRREAEEAEADAIRERYEAQVAEVEKVEAEAQRAFESYKSLSGQVEDLRERLEAALEHADAAADSGEAGLEERAAEAASQLQEELDTVSADAAYNLTTAIRVDDEAVLTRERIEKDQTRNAEKLLGRAMNAAEDAEEVVNAVMSEWTSFKANPIQKQAEEKRLSKLKKEAEAAAEEARGRVAAAEARVAEEREQSKALKVERTEKAVEFAKMRGTARRRSGREPRAAAKGGKGEAHCRHE